MVIFFMEWVGGVALVYLERALLLGFVPKLAFAFGSGVEI